MKQVDYYYWINSDWAYLGHDRLIEITRKHAVAINYMPVDLPHVYSQTGGMLLGRRAPERQAYRVMELKRWCAHLDIHVNAAPRYMCPNGDLASCLVIAAKRAGHDAGTLTKAFLHAEWVEERDISDPITLLELVRECNLDASELMAAARTAEVQAQYRTYTTQAISAGVFGSPSYVVNGELFWGQDRLDFLDQKLSLIV
jgi:2-hydroxychromene-2-carboxylate isomerase